MKLPKIFSVFKVFSENKRLRKENENLQLVNAELKEFKKGFSEFYSDLSSIKIIRQENNIIRVTEAIRFVDHLPTEHLKRQVSERLGRRLYECTEFDIMDDPITGEKLYMGALNVVVNKTSIR